MNEAGCALRSVGWLVAVLGLGAGSLRAGTLTIATYNVENYVAANRVTEEGFRRDYPKPEAQKRALRAVLKALDADLLVLQEMGSEPYLIELRRDLQRSGLDYPHYAIVVGADSDRHVAVLSRRPFSAVQRHAELPFPYLGGKERVKRGLLEVRLETAAGELTIFGLHLKSRYTDRPDDPQSSLRRIGEATAIRDLVLERFPEPATALFVIAGDCNDDKSSKPLQRMLQRGKTTVAELLRATDSRGESWTYAYRQRDSYTRVDHILVSAAVMPLVRGGTAHVCDVDGVREASDHRPVMVTLVFPDPASAQPLP